MAERWKWWCAIAVVLLVILTLLSRHSRYNGTPLHPKARPEGQQQMISEHITFQKATLSENINEEATSNGNKKEEADPKVAVLIPFLGCLPAWWEIMLYSMQANVDIADFHFFFEKYDCDSQQRWRWQANMKTREDLPIEGTRNIFFHFLDEGGLWNMTQETLRELDLPKDFDMFYRRPHKMTDYKPFYGDIFLPLLIDKDYYTHWAWSDTDLIFGCLAAFVEGRVDVKEGPQVVAFNDQRDELFLGGQFCIFKIEREEAKEIGNEEKNAEAETNLLENEEQPKKSKTKKNEEKKIKSLWRIMDQDILKQQLKDWKTTYSVDERLFSYAVLQDPNVSVSIIAAMIADDQRPPYSVRDVFPVWKDGKLLILNASSPLSLLSSSSSSPLSFPSSLSSSSSSFSRSLDCSEIIRYPSPDKIFRYGQPRIDGGGVFAIHSRAAGSRTWCRQEMPKEVQSRIGPFSGQSFFEAAFYHFYLGKKNVDKVATRRLIEEEVVEKEAFFWRKQEGNKKENHICRIDIDNNLNKTTLSFALQICGA